MAKKTKSVINKIVQNRIKWTDTEWAAHLEITVDQVPGIRKLIQENYMVYVAQYKNLKDDLDAAKRYEQKSGQKVPEYADGKWHMAIDYRHDTPSGMERWLSMLILNIGYDTDSAAIVAANKKHIPELEFTPLRAKLMDVPVKALQLLVVKSK